MLPMLVMLPLKTFADVSDKATKSLLNTFDGTILDFDASRIVWTANDKVLWLYDRTNGTQVKVYDGTGTTDVVHEAKLSAQGVAYNLHSDPASDVWPRVSSVYDWKNGQATQIATSEDLFAIRGNGRYALLGRHHVDLATGQVRRASASTESSSRLTAP